MTNTNQTAGIPTTTVTEMIEGYDALLIDAYGVLVHRDGSFPGASDFIEHLKALEKPYYILTNDASRNPNTASQSYAKRGVSIPAERIITSGTLIGPYFAQNDLAGARCVVLGPEDSRTFVKEAGGELVSPFDTDDVDVVVVCDDAGFDFLPTVEAVMSMLFRRFDAGKETLLLLPNPDLIYQKNEQDYGMASGSIAMFLEQALQLRYLHDKYQFVRLGKPYPPIFEQGYERVQSKNMVMLGDQLRTDIKGANEYGIDSVLIATGLVQLEGLTLPEALRPTYILPSLAMS